MEVQLNVMWTHSPFGCGIHCLESLWTVCNTGNVQFLLCLTLPVFWHLFLTYLNLFEYRYVSRVFIPCVRVGRHD